ncbi:MAG: retropepsin-like domain-containing protein [Pirellulales bacterium]|nr:retropepsin-like domain-containing protein [Pirellulales bacterium]
MSLLVVACLAAATSLANAEDFARLAATGLLRQGNLWVLKEESDWLARIARLRPLEKSALSAQQKYAAELLHNERRFGELEQLRRQVQELQRLAAGTEVSKGTKARLADQIRANQQLIATLEKEVADPREADRSPSVRQALIDWIDRRAELAEALLADRGLAASLAARYAELQRDPGVLAALGDVAARRRLGPSRTFELQAAALDKLATNLFSQPLPVYRQHGIWHVNVVLEERAARTLNFSPNGTEHFLAASLLESAGISVDPHAPDILIQSSGGRTVCGKRIVLANLRIGNVVFTKVAAVALPPEGEDLGSVLAGKQLAGHRLDIDPARLEAHLTPNAAPPEPAAAPNR